MRVKLRPYIELKKQGYVYKANRSEVVLTNKKFSWTSFEPFAFDIEYVVGETISEGRYETYMELFVVLED